MTGNSEDKEKCLEKLSQMQKFLPFLDFMINKIKEQNNEALLKRQLKNFQFLRSMIAKKNCKHNLEFLVKIEDVIQKIITKLKYKDQYNPQKKEYTGYLGESKSDTKDCQGLSKIFDSVETKTNMAASVSIIPSSTTTTISVTNATCLSPVTTVDSRPQDSSTNPVDLIMKTLKISVDSSMKSNTENEMTKGLLSNSLNSNNPESKSSTDISCKIKEADLQKDLDEFDLTDSSNLTEENSSGVDRNSETVDKISSHVDLLSSSREKLLKSLQKKLNPSRSDRVISSSSVECKIQNTSDAQCNSAFSQSSNQINSVELRTNSDEIKNELISENNLSSTLDKLSSHDSDSTSDQIIEKPNSVQLMSPKSFYFDNSSSDIKELESSPNDYNPKQKLREKLSADISEVYRVPGKSVGGSLRALKDIKNNKKSSILEEEELFKPDKITEVHNRCCDSKLPSESKDRHTEKSSRKSSKHVKKDEKTEDKKESRKHASDSAKYDKERYSDEGESHGKHSSDKKFEGKSSSKSLKKSSDGHSKSEKKSKKFELDNLDDDELLEFVKEHMQSLPHLSELKPSELSRVVHSHLSGSGALSDIDAISLFSEDSLQDLDDFINESNDTSEKSKSKNSTSKQESINEKKSDIDTCTETKSTESSMDSVLKTGKTVTEESNSSKRLINSNLKTSKIDVGVCNKISEEDPTEKLIKPGILVEYPLKKKKGLLELPLPKMEDLFDDILFLDNYEVPKVTNSSDSSKDISKSNNREINKDINRDVHKDTNRDTNRDINKDMNKDCSRDGNRDPRSKKQFSSAPFTYPNKPNTIPESKPSPNVYSGRSNETPTQSNYYGTGIPQNSVYGPRMQENFGAQNPQNDNFCGRMQRNNRTPDPGNTDPRHPNTMANFMPQDMNQFPRFNNRFPNDSIDPKFRRSCNFTNPPVCNVYNNDTSRHNPHYPSEPKSYAEYKRMKLREQEKLGIQETALEEKSKNPPTEHQNVTLADKDITDKNNSARNQESKHRYNDSSQNQKNTKGYHSHNSNRPYYNWQKQGKRRYSDLTDSKPRDEFRSRKNYYEDVRKEEEEKRKKINNEKRHSLDSEELVSPLDKLYQSENKPKTGRGYGLQYFKIPKKTREPTGECTNKDSILSNATKEDVNRVSVVETTKGVEPETSKTNSLNGNKAMLPDNDIKIVEKSEFKDGEKSETNNKKDDSDLNVISDDKTECKSSSKIESETSSVVPEKPVTKNDIEEQVEASDIATESKTSSNIEIVKKCETETSECDSTLNINPITENEPDQTDSKPVIVSKEEITKEFVEALIKKSFQCGEGKLLLAQAKLFEEFARKLNSKKLRTIQKIINSESDSSSSSLESSSEDEKKKKKGKKLEQKIKKGKKHKKKLKRTKKQKTSSESEGTIEEETEEKKEETDQVSESHSNLSNTNVDKNEDNKDVNLFNNNNLEVVQSETESASCDSSVLSAVAQENQTDLKESKSMDLGKCISGKKQLRKQGQKKLLEHFMNERPQQETNLDKSDANSGDVQGKETEQKIKPKTKGKCKTELEKLHDDIRSMFINSGVVTATGQRMCRILKESGGNMNNLDIVKESAKMVEEQKLKKVRTRTSTRNSRSLNTSYVDEKVKTRISEKNVSRDRSRSKNRLDENPSKEGADSEHEPFNTVRTSKATKSPVVLLQRVNLDSFAYASKLSDESIRFSNIRGGNTAIRGRGWRGISCRRSRMNLYAELEKNVFLARNKRKCEKLKDKKLKKGYVGKKIMDVVKNLPLKMARMKHLEICERKNLEKNKETKRKKMASLKTSKRNERRKKDCEVKTEGLDISKLLDYAFERKTTIYPCKLCSYVTRNITAHYVTVHPESEVLISRLCKTEAEKAIADSKENNYDVTALEQASSLEIIKRRVKSKLNGPVSYYCRMCNCSKIVDVNSFFIHVSTHTGEYRYRCPSEGCHVKMATRQCMRQHILSKHTKAKNALYGKIIELFPIPVECGNLYGFLCSKCNFVQTFYGNLESHVSKQHASEEVNIIKIDMCSKEKSERRVRRIKHSKNSSKKACCSESESSEVEEECSESDEVQSEDLTVSENKTHEGIEDSVKSSSNETPEENSNESQSGTRELRKRKRGSGENGVVEVKQGQNKENSDSDKEFPKSKKRATKALDEASDQKSENKGSVEPSVKKPMKMERTESGDEEIREVSRSGGEVDCLDLKSIARIRGSDIIDPIETNDKKDPLPLSCLKICLSEETQEDASKTRPTNQTLKVGPLEAHLLGNSNVLYECHKKGCVFSTEVFDLFEKHITITHSKTKWDGFCEICGNIEESKILFPRCYKLISALNHLRFHERKNNEDKGSMEILEVESKTVKLTDGSGEIKGENEKSPSKISADNEIIEDEQSLGKAESSDQSMPRKKFVKVRKFEGDRFAKKINDNFSGNDNIIINNVEESSGNLYGKDGGDLKNDPPMMFTIENVRSLNSDGETEDNDIEIEEVNPTVEIKNEKPIKPKPASRKPVQIRPWVTQKIAIVQAPAVNRPVVLSHLPNNTPIRIISPVLSITSIPKSGVKPIMGSTTNSFLSNSNVVSVIQSAPSATPTASPALTQAVVTPKPSFDTSKTPSSSTSKGSRKQGICRSSGGSNLTSPTEVEDLDQKDDNMLRKIYSNRSVGSKSVKDAKIYQEMLTKVKLCHLFKCMAVECSFTCNNEIVFTQHIGLHEAQRRMKDQKKSLKVIYLDSSNKVKRAFRQCAYCCEVLVNTGSALSQHIISEHGHCIYQCAYCFYRAVSQSYVEIHQDLAHSQILEKSSRIIYRCKPLSEAPPIANTIEKQGKRQCVKPYMCDHCKRKFLITQDFLDHLRMEHQSVTAYKCHVCRVSCFKADRLIAHYRLHSYSTYQCAYCLHATETENEMVFHLCNIHFSQPAYMYARDFADPQNQDGLRKLNKNKKSSGNQLDSLKVIFYESKTLNPECIIDADEEEPMDDASRNVQSVDITDIVAELGISTDNESTNSIPPLIKELASIGNKSPKGLSVESLLPNAQFSSESENGAENFSVLISSGLSTTADQNDEKDLSIPLGQLPLEAVNVRSKDMGSAPHKITASPDKNLKLNEIIINVPPKKKSMGLSSSSDEIAEETSYPKIPSAVHKMPPIVFSRKAYPKNVYPSKTSTCMKKESDEWYRGNDNFSGKTSPGHNKQCKGESSLEEIEPDSMSKSTVIQKKVTDRDSDTNIKETESASKEALSDKNKESVKIEISDRPLITNVISLSSGVYEKADPIPNLGAQDNLLMISDVCSLSCNKKEKSDGSNVPRKIIVNIESKMDTSKPPIIRVEDYPIEKEGNVLKALDSTKKTIKAKSEENLLKSKEEPENKSNDTANSSVGSPEVIILEEDEPVKEPVFTVTIDSEDEKETENTEESSSKATEKRTSTISADDTIRKEMELLRNQIASETDCLLFDDTTTASTETAATTTITTTVKTPQPDLSIKLPANENNPISKSETILSPIEEDVSLLIKKLHSESSKSRDEDGDQIKKEQVSGTPKKQESTVSTPTVPRTRASVKREEAGESFERSDSEDSNSRSFMDNKRLMKDKKFIDGLIGKELYICGNEKCNFAAEEDTVLKDHLFVCDLSRESSLLMCPHCLKQIKHFNPYIEHLKHHGEKRFSCGLCSFSSPVKTSVTRHAKQKHKCPQLKSLPTDPPKEGYLVFYPKNYKVEKKDFVVDGYSPGDEDKLPLSAIYQVNVKCAQCPYFTKVRSNMVRHLKFHVKSVESEGVVVPSTAPTNPVPCLSAKERMFDKMTNLAASSQLAQNQKNAVEMLSPEEEAKLPQFVAEQMRYKCCLPDCNYITVDDGMLKHHIKALHDEVNYYSCPHCRSTVHVDVRHVTLDKIGHHLKHHDSKLYKCAHCIYFHYQKNVVEKHTAEKHPDKRYFVYTVREPKTESASEEEHSSSEAGPKVWKCGLCQNCQSPSRLTVMDHLAKTHNTKSKYKCQLCDMKSNQYHIFVNHFASKHAGEKVGYIKTILKVSVNETDCRTGLMNPDPANEHFDTTPLWQRGAPRARHIRGILIEEEEVKKKKTRKISEGDESESSNLESVTLSGNAFYCPLCSDTKKAFRTKNSECFRNHLYEELNYQQYACILCGKMFVDKNDFEKHHAKTHPDKAPAMKQTKEDKEVMLYVDKVIAKQREQMEDKKRRLSEDKSNVNQGAPKKKKKSD